MKRAADAEDKIVGAIIRRKRLAAGLSMADLGRTIGCVHQQVHKYETGIDRVAVVTLLKISAALRTTAADLMSEIAAKLAQEQSERQAAE